MTTNEVVEYRHPASKVSKTRNVAVIYRLGVRNQMIIPGGLDQWFFLDLRSSYYTCGTSFDMVFLMDGITKEEFIRAPAFVYICPCLKRDATILEAG